MTANKNTGWPRWHTYQGGVFIFCFSFVLLASCAKRVGPDTPYSNIQGTWRLTQTATDDNNNQQLDNSEIQPVAANDVESFQFKSDGTGVQNVKFNGNNMNYTFTWSLQNKNTDLYRVMQGNDTIVSHILNLSSDYFSFMDTKPVLSWYFLQKK